MGLKREAIEYINNFILLEFKSFDINMLELGDQKIRNIMRTQGTTGKEYYKNKGVNHVSIDLNGKKGSLKHDLSKPIINPNWINYFDVITNSGTTEHIEPYESQYECFRNIHNFTKPGGLIIHIVPDYDKYVELNAVKRNHCNNYYSESFFKILSVENKYKLIDSRLIGGNRAVCLKKIVDSEFLINKDLLLSEIHRESGAKVYDFSS